MAKVEISTLGAGAFNGSFVNKLNTNLSNLAEAVNNGVLWRTNATGGQSSMSSSLNMNGYNILNGYVDGTSLITIRDKALSIDVPVKKAEAWAEAAEQYAEDAESFASSANDSAGKAAIQAGYAKTSQVAAAASALSVASQADSISANSANITALSKVVAANRSAADSSIASLASTVATNKTTSDTGIATNASAISSLASTVASNKTSTDTTAASLSATITSNKASADATATSLATLTTTVTSNKTSADATATSLSTLSTTVSSLSSTVSSNTSSISSVSTVASAALPKAGGTMTGAITMGSNAISFGSYSLSNSGTYLYSTAAVWSSQGYRCQQGIGASTNSGNIFNYNWNSSSEMEIWIDSTRIGKITVAAVSDKELKEDITYVEQDALSEVVQWKPATFAYKARGILPKSDSMLGFIANDLVAVSPECVTGKGLGEEWDENAPADAYELVPVAILAKLTRAVQQLSAKVEALEAAAS